MKIEAVENLEPDDKSLDLLFPGIIPEHVARYAFIKEYAGGFDHPSILDLASARGYGSDILKKLYPNGEVLGFEKGFGYTQKAVNKYKQEGKSPYFSVADVKRLPISENTADLMAVFEIIEHLPHEDQPLLFSEINRVLKQNGLAFISFPERYSFHKKDGRVVRNKLIHNKHHLYEPTDEEVRNMIANSGLKIAGEYGQHFINPGKSKLMIKISRMIPLYPFFSWTIPRDHNVLLKKDKQGMTPLTHIYVVKKS